MIGWFNEWGRLWYEPFGLMVVQNTVFLGVVFAVLYRLRDASARVRHAVAMVGLVKLILPPFVPASMSTAPGYVELPAIAAIPYSPIPGVTGATAGGSESLTLAGLLLVVWCAVAVGVMVHAAIATLRLKRALRGAEDARDDESVALVRETGVRVRVTDRVPVPMTVGVLPAAIFVPPHWAEWTPAGRRSVLRHEMAHIRRRDGVVRPFETLVRALYWFHPLVALLVRHADVYREQSCDEVAAAPNPAGRLAYSRHLVDIAEHLMTGSAVRGSASTIMRRRDELLGRVRYLTKEGPIMKLTKARATALAVVLAAAVVSLSWYQGEATPPKEAKKGVELSLQAGGTITVDGKKAPIEKLGDVLGKSIDDRDQAVVNIVCEDGVEMKTLFEMHAVLRGAGLLKVRYADQEGEPVPLVLPSKELIEKTKQISAENIATLAIAPGGACTLDGKKLPAEKAYEVIAKRLEANPNLIVSVKMAGEATYGQYVHALRELGRAEAKRIFIQEPAGI